MESKLFKTSKMKTKDKYLLSLQAGRQQAQRDFRGAMQAQNQKMLGGVGSIVGAGYKVLLLVVDLVKDGFKMDTLFR